MRIPSNASAIPFTLAVTAAAVVVRWGIDPWLGDHLPLVTLFAAVAAAAWRGGVPNAVLAAVAGYLACDFLFQVPRLSLAWGDVRTQIGLLAYLVSCAVIAAFAAAMRSAQRRTKEGQELMRTTLASIGDAVMTTDVQGHITFLNTAAESLTGWTSADASGRPIEEVFRIADEKTGAPVENPVTRALREGAVVGLANRAALLRKDGEECSIDDSAAPIRDPSGALIGCVLVFRDVTEQRHVESAIARSESDLADTFENAGVGLNWVGSDGTVLRANQTELRMLGYERDEYVGHRLAEFHVDAAVIADLVRRLAAGEIIRDAPAQMRCKNGVIKDVIIDASVLWHDGKFVHARCVTRDVSASKQAQEAQGLLAAIVAASDDAIVSKTLQGIILSWNAGAERLFGYTAAEAIGQSIGLIIPQELQDEERTILQRLQRGERIDHFETVRTTKHGQRIDISLTVSPLRDASGRIVGASKVARDITERKRTEAALRVAEAHLRIVTESMATPVTRCSRDLRYLWVGKHYAEWLGLSPEEIVGRPIAEVLGAAGLEGIRPHIERVLMGEEVRFEQQIPFRGVGPRWISAVYTPTFDAMGTPDGWVAVVLDIEHRKQTEHDLREADRRKDEFLATLAHELRNPMAPVRNALEIMKLAPGDPAMVERARDTMDRQVTQMERLIEDLLDVSRITRDRLGLRKEPLALDGVLRMAVEACRPAADRAKHEVVLTVPPQPIFVSGDAVRLAQAFGNLLNNACKFTRPGGRIEVSAIRDGDDLVVSVKDNGVGIPPGMLSRIFDMFSQVNPALDREHGGLGIGLTLVKKLVELHDGRVEARSRGAGLGSEFLVRLPALADGAPQAPSPPPAAPARQVPCRILVVDDNRDNAESLTMLLRISGHTTQLAFDGIEAVATAKQFRPDIVLLDLGLPKLSGFDVCRMIRTEPWGRHIFLVALSGWGQEDDRRKSADAGFDKHLVKPVGMDVLAEVIESAATRRALR